MVARAGHGSWRARWAEKVTPPETLGANPALLSKQAAQAALRFPAFRSGTGGAGPPAGPGKSEIPRLGTPAGAGGFISPNESPLEALGGPLRS